MKVLLINDYATQTGGAEFLTLALREGLQKRGHDARLFTSSARPLGAQSLADYECLGTLSRFRILLQTLNPWAWLKLRQILIEFQPDVVHVTIALTQLSPLIFSLLNNVPAVYNAQWYRAMCPTGTKILPTGKPCQVPMGFVCYSQHCLPLQDWLLLSAQMQMTRRWFKAFDKVIAASKAVKDRLSTADITQSIDIIWNGIPKCPARPPLDSPPTVVFAGRLVWEKGVDVLLKAFAQVQQHLQTAKLLIAGDGIERENLEKLATQLNIHTHVSFLGHVSRSDLDDLFSQAWVQVIPSRWAEPFGLVAAEAHMRRTAVIASNLGGLAEIVRHGQTGFLISPNDSDLLSENLLKILKNKNLAEKFGEAGREIAIQHFSEDAFVENFAAVYQNLVDEWKINERSL